MSLINNQPKIVLASGSTYRKKQLEQLEIKFQVVEPEVDERSLQLSTPQATASVISIRLAELKASNVCRIMTDAFVIGCDQTADLEGIILGKPGNIANAEAQLRQCSGKEVIFYSSICLQNSALGLLSNDTIETRVKFRHLSKKEITAYIEKEMPLNCAGSFMCEGLGISLFESIDSCDPSALIGLPLISLNRMLLKSGINCLL